MVLFLHRCEVPLSAAAFANVVNQVHITQVVDCVVQMLPVVVVDSGNLQAMQQHGGKHTL